MYKETNWHYSKQIFVNVEDVYVSSFLNNKWLRRGDIGAISYIYAARGLPVYIDGIKCYHMLLKTSLITVRVSDTIPNMKGYRT